MKTAASQAPLYQPGKFYAPLDGLRGMAILLVILLHFSFGPGGTRFDHVFFLANRLGNAGVDLFFVLSGFLITGILLDAKGSSDFFRSFYVRRTLRIFPLYYAYLFFMLLLLPVVRGAFHGLIHQTAAPVEHQAWFWLYASNIAPLIYGPFTTPGMTHLWSLAVEEQFYLVWPLVVWLTPRHLLARLCLGMMLLAPLLRALCLHSGQPESAFHLMPCRMDTLAIGALLALAARNQAWTNTAQRLRRPAIAVTLPLIAALVVFRGRWDAGDWCITTLGLSAVAILSAALLTEILWTPTGPLPSAAQWPLLRNLGKYSYGIYVLHATTEHLLGPILQRRLHLPTLGGSPLLNQLATYLVLGTASYAAAAVSFSLLEKPFLRLKTRFPYREIRVTLPAPARELHPVAGG